jgi:hypothetical protein
MKSLLFIAGVSITACSHRPYIEPVTPNGIAIKSAQLGMYHKEVVTKKDPDTLIAPDGTMCRVAPDVYKSAALHSVMYCNWQ